MSDPSARLIDTAARLGLAWRFVRRVRPSVLGEAFADGIGEEGLETGDVETLDVIAITGEARMSDVAAGLLIDPSTATRAVDRLEERGLVSRRRDPQDARINLVALTDAGGVLQRKESERRTAGAIRLLEHFDPQDQEEIGRLLPMLADAIADELGVARAQGDRAAAGCEARASVPRNRLAQIAVEVELAWRFLRRARAAIVGAAMRDAAIEPRLEVGDIDTLDEIAAAGGHAQMSDIAAGLQVDPSSATRAVGRLVGRGLAARRRDSDDGRILRVSLTDAGTAARTSALEARLGFTIRLLEQFGSEDHAAIDRLMPALVEVIAGAIRSDR